MVNVLVLCLVQLLVNISVLWLEQLPCQHDLASHLASVRPLARLRVGLLHHISARVDGKRGALLVVVLGALALLLELCCCLQLQEYLVTMCHKLPGLMGTIDPWRNAP